MNTAMQNQRRRNRQSARASALASDNYRQVGYLDALLKKPLRCPYPEGIASYEWQLGYDAGRRELEVQF